MNVNTPLNIQPGDLRCPRCFGKDLVPSLPRGILDGLMRKLDRIPRHCRFCGKRFYVKTSALKTARAAAAGSSQ